MHCIRVTARYRSSMSSAQKRLDRWGNTFFIACLVIIAIEMGVRWYLNEFSGFILNIPVIYLLWNLLVLAFVPSEKEATDSFTLRLQDYGLSPREQEITARIAAGKTNKEIAYELGLSVNTVRNHISSIFQKTHARSRVDLLNLIKGN